MACSVVYDVNIFSDFHTPFLNSLLFLSSHLLILPILRLLSPISFLPSAAPTHFPLYSLSIPLFSLLSLPSPLPPFPTPQSLSILHNSPVSSLIDSPTPPPSHRLTPLNLSPPLLTSSPFPHIKLTGAFASLNAFPIPNHPIPTYVNKDEIDVEELGRVDI